jgi:hypothetical protein
MAIAWACEAHNALQTQAVTFDRKRRQMIFAARNYELLRNEVDTRIQTVKEQVNTLIQKSLEKVSRSEVPGKYFRQQPPLTPRLMSAQAGDNHSTVNDEAEQHAHEIVVDLAIVSVKQSIDAKNSR